MRATSEQRLEIGDDRASNTRPVFLGRRLEPQLEAFRLVLDELITQDAFLARHDCGDLRRVDDAPTWAKDEVTDTALQLFGGLGLTRDCPMEKLYRDARASLIEDGANDVLALVGARRLLAKAVQN